MITIEKIKELRDSTGVSVMQCKKALEEADGDIEKALIILKKKSSDIAAKRADREATDGIIIIKNNAANDQLDKSQKAALLELYCETDFVAKNEDFVSLANSLADILLTEGEEAVKSQAPEKINQMIQKVGENIRLGHITVVEAPVIGSYSHNGKIAVIVGLEGGNSDIARDLAMHIAAMKPEYINSSEIPEDARQKAREIFQKEVDESGKPEEIKQKMLEGKLKTYFSEQTLLEQAFIKNPEQKVKDLLEKAGARVQSVLLRSI